jgi:hypothetical protein
MQARKGLAFGLEHDAILIVLGVADARLVTVTGFSDAKTLVHPQAPLLNMH